MQKIFHNFEVSIQIQKNPDTSSKINDDNYCDCVYGPYLINRLSLRFQKVQNACMRFALNIQRSDHITPHFNKHGILRINNRHLLHSAVLTYRLSVEEGNLKYLSDLLIKRCDIHRRNTRSEGLLEVPKHRTEKLKSSFSGLVIVGLNFL